MTAAAMATAAATGAAAADATASADDTGEGRPEGERKRRRRRRRGRGGSREGRETTAAPAGADLAAEEAGDSGDEDARPTETMSASTEAPGTADTQPLPILAQPPGLPVAYEAPGLPVAVGTHDAFAETVTLHAGALHEGVPAHPDLEAAGVDSEAAGDEAAASAVNPEAAATAAGTTTDTAPQEEEAVTGATETEPVAEEEAPKYADPTATQRYTVWSSGPGTGGYHFGPKGD